MKIAIELEIRPMLGLGAGVMPCYTGVRLFAFAGPISIAIRLTRQ